MTVRGTQGDPRTQSLADVLQRLGSFDEDATIFVADEPPAADTPALVCPEGSQPPGWAYLLEIYLAREVLEVWRQWRGLRDASAEEALTAVLHYAENDAYLPNDDG